MRSSSPAILEHTLFRQQPSYETNEQSTRRKTTFDYDNYVLSIDYDGQSATSSTSSITPSLKTDCRLSLTSTLPNQTTRNYFHSDTSSIKSERKKKIISRIVTIVTIFIFIVCITLVALTLRLAHKIDELVRLKHLMPKPVQQYRIDDFILLRTPITTTTTTKYSRRKKTISKRRSKGHNTITKTNPSFYPMR
ncbi:unnamed protein product [Didymodactylos carnosus]|uniref:Uncharacterized protein n=1 Tax=Didymodactylos carnosus TaxID=1234261 RepID=A0A815VD40_9BILA|nr:unnamed protein product [Didymodactylos carnosus]CAF1534272.1 unnamed protein product [Didymodactylos carnosus]CAF4214049.1 unnamed protein product [Didymodactylos carnosus]CAF4393929.1 unnamed protein product [Didymodactylos carnosus]